MRKLSFNEISDWEEFEELAAAFFRLQANDPDNSVLSVEVFPSGKGSDGGKDILIKIHVDDSIQTFSRAWVVQCKFYKNDVRKSDLADVNIPSLIHQYGADGYLLVCKRGVVNTLATFFEELNKNCRFGYSYLFWSGEEFKGKLLLADKVILKQFFPKTYFDYERKKNL